MRSVSVIGAGGFLGGRILGRLRQAAGSGLRVTGTTRGASRNPALSRLDVTDAAALAAHLRQGFDLLVLAAGTKDVRRCEADPAYAQALHLAPVRELIRVVERERLPTRIVLLSTDYVFDGERGGYRPDDLPGPRTWYGRSKRLAEVALLEAGGGHKVVRSGGVLGRGAHFLDWLLRELASSREVRLFDDCFGSPTPAELLAGCVADLLCCYDQVPDEVLHLVGDRRMSRLELGRLVAGLLGIAGDRLVPEGRATGGPLFQPDLSLEPSAFARERQREGLEEYLRRELALR